MSSLQARLATLLTDLAGHRKGYSSVEQRLAGRRVVEEVEAKLRETDANIAGVLAAIAELPEEAAEGAAEEARKAEAAAVKAAEASSREAQLAIRSASSGGGMSGRTATQIPHRPQIDSSRQIDLRSSPHRFRTNPG